MLVTLDRPHVIKTALKRGTWRQQRRAERRRGSRSGVRLPSDAVGLEDAGRGHGQRVQVPLGGGEG